MEIKGIEKITISPLAQQDIAPVALRGIETRMVEIERY